MYIIKKLISKELLDNITTEEMELALYYYCVKHSNDWFCTKGVQSILGHECDFVYLSKSLYAHEIEIKVSVSDTKADLKKEHGHISNRIKSTTFAVPHYIADKVMDIIPNNFGVLEIYKYKNTYEICKYADKEDYMYKAKSDDEYDELLEKWKATEVKTIEETISYGSKLIRKSKQNKDARKLTYE